METTWHINQTTYSLRNACCSNKLIILNLIIYILSFSLSLWENMYVFLAITSESGYGHWLYETKIVDTFKEGGISLLVSRQPNVRTMND